MVPMYLTKDYSAPAYMDTIVDPIGIEYGDETLTVKNLFETDRMMSTLKTMRKYYEAGYINKDAALASDDKCVKRFVTKGTASPMQNWPGGRIWAMTWWSARLWIPRLPDASAKRRHDCNKQTFQKSGKGNGTSESD